MRDARGRFYRPDPLADLATYRPPASEPRVVDQWGVPAHLLRAYPQRVDKPVDRLAARDALVARHACGGWQYRGRPCSGCGQR